MMLGTDRMQALFGSVLGRIYEDAVLEVWTMGTTRGADGTFPYTKASEAAIKVQRDACTESQVQADDYTASDVRFLILQSGVATAPDSDCRVRYRSETYRLFAPITQDPARVYWDARARKVA